MPSQRLHEHRRAAARAGLKYVTDGFAGITRRRSGTGWSYYAPNGSRIRDAEKRRRINKLAIPPAWTDVWICPDPDGHIQATARDARGRKQYRYHASYREARDRSKFRHMLEFSEVLPLLRNRIERDLKSETLTRDQVLATVIRLLDKTLIVVAGEFGRPPEFDGGGGRGHWSKAFSVALAGGGLKTGCAIGETDELAKQILSRPVSVPDLHATIHCALGINPARNLHDGDRPVPITDMGEPVREIFS